ncbi:MAG TPA: protoheme IX farnesyltransferase [Ignavibacteriaceae bacterium]|nr:protoheme IX farnesyltransferase [Ignavibacteriaceae bacterium]
MKNKIEILLELTKFRITFFVTITAVFGFVSNTGSINTLLITPALGILFLACSSAVLNHIQERTTDAIMERTKQRPIPSGRISAAGAVLIFTILFLIGSSLLFFFSGWITLLLGLLNLLWYNAIYTPLKKKTALAIIPGSLVGAIPPMIGWVASGGYIFDPAILMIAFFFFIWQIPHFWLLLLMLNKEYENAGFPTLTKIFNQAQLSRITFVWIAATAVSAIIIPLYGLTQFTFINLLLLAAGIWLTIRAVKLITATGNRLEVIPAFRQINIFALIVIVLISLDKLLSNI